jgi:hypothetical protein
VLDEFEEEEESDDEKWFPKYKDCECCKGFIYKCKGDVCLNMDACNCKMKDECENYFRIIINLLDENNWNYR